MVNDLIVEDSQKRYKRYQSARTYMDLWSSLLHEAYKYCIPDRDDFYDKTKAQSRMDDIFDSTAITGIHTYANNIQSFLTPPFSRWAKLVPSKFIDEVVKLSDTDKKELTQKLEEYTEVLFNYLDNSNFLLKSHEVLQDLAIGTAVLVINEGNDVVPFDFLDVPISHVAVSKGADGTLENFWRKWGIPVRLIQQKWPKIQLPQFMESLLKSNPDQEVKLIEGCIRYPENNEEHQFFYYIQAIDNGIQDIFTEWRSYSPFIGFRASVAVGETLGRGIALKVLPDIKVLNKMKEMILRGASLRAFPLMLLESDSVLNPHKLRMEAGELIPIKMSTSGKDPIRPIQVGGDVNFSQLIISELTQLIKDAFGSDPLGSPIETTNQSATQTLTRQQNWLRQNAPVVARLTAEWLNPLLEKCLIILRKKNLLSDLIINGQQIEIKLKSQIIAIDYVSPLLEIQDQEDAQKMQGYLAWLEQTFGTTALAMVPKVAETQLWMAQKMNVPSKLLNNKEIINGNMQQLAKQTQQAAMLQAQKGVPPLAPGEQLPPLQIPPISS